MIPYPHSENLEKNRKEPTNTNTAYTITNTLVTSVIIITVDTKTIIAISDNIYFTISTIVIVILSNIHYVISDTIYTDLNSDNIELASTNDDNMNSSIIKDNSFTHVDRCKDIRIHKTEDTIKILS